MLPLNEEAQRKQPWRSEDCIAINKFRLTCDGGLYTTHRTECEMPRADRQPIESPDASSPADPSVQPRAQSPDEDQVARLAYELFLKRGGAHGHDQEDWFQAERQLREPSKGP
jgi:hypothetical protein